MNAYLEKSAGRSYVERTREEFDAILVERLKFTPLRIPDCHEVVYDRISSDGRYTVRVYSSVHLSDGLTRDCGKDAIRVVMINRETGYPMKIMGEGKGKNTKAGKRINRTKGAMANLERRVKEYLILGSPDKRCKKCGAVMKVMRGRHGPYLLCTDKNDLGHWCSNTADAPDWVK